MGGSQAGSMGLVSGSAGNFDNSVDNHFIGGSLAFTFDVKKMQLS